MTRWAGRDEARCSPFVALPFVLLSPLPFVPMFVPLVALLLLLPVAPPARAAAPPKTVVLIGGSSSEGPGRHDYRQGLQRIAAWLESLPAGARPGQRLAVVRYFDGWPADARALDRASTLVLYCDGDARHPLLDAERARQFDALMQRGVGLVALHQASTLPTDQTGLLQRWLGGARAGLFDRTTQTATLEPNAHATTRGVATFSYRDEFYPTLRLAAQGVVPVLAAELHPQFRDGQAVVEDLPQQATVAWAFERAGGGRSFGYTGAHFSAAFDQPMLRRLLVNAILWTAGVDAAPGSAGARARAATPTRDLPPAAAPAQPQASLSDVLTFHHDPQRSGWQRNETLLTPTAVAGPGFGPLWQSPPLHADGEMPARLYASPLYLDRLLVTAGQHRGETFSAVLAATSNGDVYAINAVRAGDVAPGRILWRTRLAPPCRLQPAPLDGVATGVLSTPVIDAARGRLYVTHCDPRQRWQAYALDLGSGAVLPGWPVRLDEAALNAVNRNAGPVPVPPRRRNDFRVQRGALNLSPDGARLYVVFGETETGWLVSVDTVEARIASAFASAAMPHRGSGGIWGAGGPALDERGDVYIVTGSGFDGFIDQPNDWTQSLLKLTDDASAGLKLTGSYTPFNHCASAKADIDLGAGGAALLPAATGMVATNGASNGVPNGMTNAPRLLVVGGKQGNAYLLDRDRLPGRLDRRPPCGDDPASDGSLLAPGPQPQFGGRRGPLNVFGPYSEDDAALDTARARSVPAAMRGADGRLAVFMTGSSRAAAGSTVSVAPSLVRLEVRSEGHPQAQSPPYLHIDRRQPDVAFINPGSPVISSHGAVHAIAWVLDENGRRSALLSGANAPAPVLYAFDATTLALLWRSAPGALHTSGKYNEPLVTRGQVIVGTDRIQAFGLGAIAGPPGAPAPTTPGAATAFTPSTPPTAPTPAPQAAADPATVWRQRCAACHDQAVGNIPPRERITTLAWSRIVDALSQGAMRPQASGLGAHDIDALARWLTTNAGATVPPPPQAPDSAAPPTTQATSGKAGP